MSYRQVFHFPQLGDLIDAPKHTIIQNPFLLNLIILSTLFFYFFIFLVFLVFFSKKEEKDETIKGTKKTYKTTIDQATIQTNKESVLLPKFSSPKIVPK
jgi:hypothetical protein